MLRAYTNHAGCLYNLRVREMCYRNKYQNDKKNGKCRTTVRLEQSTVDYANVGVDLSKQPYI